MAALTSPPVLMRFNKRLYLFTLPSSLYLAFRIALIISRALKKHQKGIWKASLQLDDTTVMTYYP